MEQLLGQFSLGLFILQAVIFIGLVLLLKKFAWKPILDAVNEREEGIKNALLSAENAKKEMQQLKADNEKIVAEALLQRDAIIKEAKEIKNDMIETAKENAQEQVNKMVQAAKESIEREKTAVLFDMKKQISVLSVEIAEKVLRNELSNKDVQNQLVTKLLDETKLN